MKNLSTLAAWPNRVPRALSETIGLAAFLAALALVVYWPSWSVPLSYDGAWFMRLVHEFSIVDAFTQTANSGYYRPLINLFFRWAGTLGPSTSLWLHGLGLGVEIANALLLGRFARALSGRPNLWLEGGVGFLFILNPLNAQTVVLASGLNHLPALLFILIGALAYVAARRSARWWAWLLCGLACALAFLTHEMGVMVSAFCVVYELALALREKRWVRQAWACVGVVGLAVGYLLIYALIPKGQAVDLVLSPGDFLLRGLYVIQSLAYPAAFLLNGLLPPGPAIALAGGLTAVAVLLTLKGRWGVYVLAGTALAAGAALPSVLRLPADYLLNSPRVLYISCAGVALLWAGLALALAEWLQQVEAGIRLAALAALGLLGFWHIQSQEALVQRAHEPVTAMVEQALTLPPEGRLLVVNLPEWVAPPTRHLPLGSEGVVLMAKYIDGRDLILANTGLDRQVELLQLPIPYRADLPYAYQAFGRPTDMGDMASATYSATQVLWVRYEPAGLRTDWLGGVRGAGAGEPIAVFGQQFALISVQAEPCRSGWMVSSVWQRPANTQANVPASFSAFVQALGPDGSKIAQADGALLGGLLPFGQMPVQQEVVDRRLLKSETSSAPNDLTLYLGLYDYQANVRLAGADGSGARLEADAVTVPLAPPNSAVCR